MGALKDARDVGMAVDGLTLLVPVSAAGPADEEIDATRIKSETKHVGGDRSGRTFLVTRDGVLFFQQLKGDEHSASGPPHDQLGKLAGIGFERILAGGAVTNGSEARACVKWLSGACQLGPTLKRAVN